MIIPLKDRVVIKRIESDEKTSGGIILPDANKEKVTKGEIIAVGTGAVIDGNIIPMEVKVGDKVLFEKWSGSEFEIDGEEVVIVKESDIIGIL